ncbi:MAG: phosphoribosyltransferase [Chloroflexota bacterium]
MHIEAGYQDRTEAGIALARALERYRGTRAIAVGMARGGIAVAAALATALQLPLVPLIIRKLRAPENPELALGAISETGEQWVDYEMMRLTGTTGEYLQSELEHQFLEATRLRIAYSGFTGIGAVRDRPAIVVDDGIATGSSALVAVRSVRGMGAERLVLATPAASSTALSLLRSEVDEVEALLAPDVFIAVGAYYHRFDQVDDAEVLNFLRRSAEFHQQ